MCTEWRGSCSVAQHLRQHCKGRPVFEVKGGGRRAHNVSLSSQVSELARTRFGADCTWQAQQFISLSPQYLDSHATYSCQACLTSHLDVARSAPNFNCAQCGPGYLIAIRTGQLQLDVGNQALPSQRLRTFYKALHEVGVPHHLLLLVLAVSLSRAYHQVPPDLLALSCHLVLH